MGIIYRFNRNRKEIIMFEKVFKLNENGTSVKTEVMAGLL